MTIKYLDHLPHEFRNRAARLFLSALRDKIVPILGDNERTLIILERSFVTDHCLTAFENDEFVGLLGIQKKTGGMFNFSAISLFREYGILRGIHHWLGLCLLHHFTQTDEWYVDGVAVDETMRGKGVGTGLLDFMERLARKEGKMRLSLNVINTNEKAKALYSRLGFVETEKLSVWPYNLFYKFPFNAVITMVKSLR